MYSLGAFLVSADDDMRPHALIESSPESLNADEISRGKPMKTDADGFVQKSFDLLTSFHDVLGRRVSELPGNYEKGELLIVIPRWIWRRTSRTISRATIR